MLETLFIGCAVFGGVVMVMQFLLTALGVGGGEDADGVDLPDDAGGGPVVEHHGAFGLLRVLSFRTVVAGATFFGLGGLAGIYAAPKFGLAPNLAPLLSICTATLFGLSAVYIVHYLYRWMYSLRYDGSVNLQTLVGSNGSVYVRIPPYGATGGKVLVNHQERTMEYEAITQGEELKAGTPIQVVRVISETVVEVTKA
ncbi:MAG: hypothetical protein FWC43_03535 [Planctomycetaceae bacterium]|nr:hypothetical protein [Planctomycetaceae bacterium]